MENVHSNELKEKYKKARNIYSQSLRRKNLPILMLSEKDKLKFYRENRFFSVSDMENLQNEKQMQQSKSKSNNIKRKYPHATYSKLNSMNETMTGFNKTSASGFFNCTKSNFNFNATGLTYKSGTGSSDMQFSLT